jgi:hypothetical protein
MTNIQVNTTNTVIDLSTTNQTIDLVSDSSYTLVTSTRQTIELLDGQLGTIIQASPTGISIQPSTGDPSVGSVLIYPIAPGVSLANGKAVQLIDSELQLASIDDPLSAYSTIGIFDAANGSVVTDGRVSNSAWNWTIGIPLFLGRDGELVHIPLVDSPFYLQVANVLNPTQIQVDIQQPIYTS